jgi:hypothetical protein
MQDCQIVRLRRLERCTRNVQAPPVGRVTLVSMTKNLEAILECRFPRWDYLALRQYCLRQSPPASDHIATRCSFCWGGLENDVEFKCVPHPRIIKIEKSVIVRGSSSPKYRNKCRCEFLSPMLNETVRVICGTSPRPS